MAQRLILIVAALLVGYACTSVRDTPAPVRVVTPALDSTRPTPSATPQVLVLGDSQISFGAGAAYLAFFKDLGRRCSDLPPRWGTTDTAAVGVRSTSLHHWTALSGPARGTICDVDPRFGVNAGSYGVGSSGLRYVQIGADPDFPFCPGGQSPLAAVFNTGSFDPDLVVLSFLGNATDRWQSASSAVRDWADAVVALPAGLPCVAMTTIPTFDRAENDRRAAAQANLARAVTADGRCAFVPGITDQTRAAIEGNRAFFRSNDAGEITDARHPTTVSAQRFFDIQTPRLCTALRRLLPE